MAIMKIGTAEVKIEESDAGRRFLVVAHTIGMRDVMMPFSMGEWNGAVRGVELHPDIVTLYDGPDQDRAMTIYDDAYDGCYNKQPEVKWPA